MRDENMLEIVNPATEETIERLEVDTAESIHGKFAGAAESRGAWQDTGLAERMTVVRRFASLLEEQADVLASTLTAEMGKPIVQARNELRGTLSRIEFFLDHVAEAMQPHTVLSQEDMVEEIRWEPLGVVANVSAWNYPYFVGSNVFVPALLTGNAVLYKPSEHATLTGLAIADLLWESGVPAATFAPIVGGGEVGGRGGLGARHVPDCRHNPDQRQRHDAA